MNTIEAFMRNLATPDGHGKVFDWDKAAEIIKERKPYRADAGLQGDLEWTAGKIWENDEPVYDDYIYLASSWATPVLLIDDEEIPCYQPQGHKGWDADTKWPESALAIVKGQTVTENG